MNDKAILPEWQASPLDSGFEATFPPGNAVYEGMTAPQTAKDGTIYPGGTPQVFIPDVAANAQIINKWGFELVMELDINILTLDMLRFSELLRLMNKFALAQNYESLAVDLRADASPQAVKDVREFILDSFRGGMGGLTDLYVQKKDGSLDEVLNAEYERVLQKLTDFVNGV